MDVRLANQVEAASFKNETKNAESLGRKAASAEDREALRKSAQDFESIFVNMMMKSMRSSVQKSGFLDGGNAEEIYKGMLDQEYSKMMSKSGRLGLADTIERQLTRAAGWEPLEKQGEANISHLEKTKGLQAYGAIGLNSDQKDVTIIEGKN
jgi:flagellar protein FlgJ